MSYNAGNSPKGYLWIVEQVDHQGDDCLLWPFACCTPGYGNFMFERKTHLAHRWMCQQIHGASPGPRYQAAHSCGNRRCVNPGHLNWKTPSDNQLDRRGHGTNNKTKTKITPLQAKQIRQLKGTETGIDTAARYGITESNVRLIQDGKTWRTLDRKHRHALTSEQVRQIKNIGYEKSAREVAELLGVCRSAVFRARNNKTATARQQT